MSLTLMEYLIKLLRLSTASKLHLYDASLSPIQVIDLPNPLPLYYELPIPSGDTTTLHYQLSVFDQEGNEDRTGVGQIGLTPTL